MCWTDIEGQFTRADATIYQAWAEWCSPDAVFVELGTAYGRSAACLLEAVAARDKYNVTLYCIDMFPRHTLPVAVANLRAWRRQVRIVQCDIVRAAALFSPQSVAGVYIDADHTANGLTRTLAAWVPVLISDGRIGGHDYSAGWPAVRNVVDQLPPTAVTHWLGSSWEYHPARAGHTHK